MTLRHTHIISSVGWDTTFTQKGRSGDLQDRLSRWSRWRMPDELQSILDTLCPADQFWHIDQLQLDLGVIDYADLENELSATIREALQETLRTMLYRQMSGDDTKFKIVNAASTDLQTLGFFLQNGYMPSYHSTQQLTYNKLFSQLLEQQTQATVQVIREIGKGNPDVRKRMAWQTDEPVLHQLVKGLEPVHHIEIISFTGEMTALQNKENLVTASQHGFKKNLWNWILNYLLQEKDTVFNKLAFVKSSLKQLAAHYNLEYEKLLNTTSRALEAVRKKMQLRTDLGRILALLAQQIGTTGTADPVQQDRIDYWERFSILLNEEGHRQTRGRQEEFNELFIALAGIDKDRFMKMIYPLGYSSKKWENIAAQLSPASMEVLFTLVNPRKGSQWLFILQWMHRTAGSVIASGGEVILRLAGIKFLLRYQRSSLDIETFARYCAGQLAKEAGLDAEAVYKMFCTSPVTSSSQTLQQVEITHVLQVQFLEQLRKRKDKAFTGDIEQLLQHIVTNDTTFAETTAGEWQNKLRQLLSADPDSLLDALMKHPKKRKLIEYVMDKINSHQLTVLLAESSHIHARLIRNVTTTLKNVFAGTPELEEWVSRFVPAEAFSIIATKPAISSSALIRKLLRVVLMQQQVFATTGMEAALVRAGNTLSASRGIKAMLRVLIDQEWSTKNPEQRIRIWARFAGKNNTDRRHLAERIAMCRQQQVFRKLTGMPIPETKIILDKLVPGSSVFARQLFDKYQLLLNENGYAGTGWELRLSKVFWLSVIETALADKDIGYLRLQMGRSVSYLCSGLPDGLPRQTTQVKQANSNETDATYSQEKLTPEFVLRLLKYKAYRSNTSISVKYKQVSYADFLQLLLTEETEVLTAAIIRDGRRQELLKQLKAGVELEEFIWWTAGVLPQGQSALLKELQLMLHVTNKLFPDAKVRTAKRGWALAMAIIQGNIRTASTFQRIVQEIVRTLMVKTVPPADIVLSTLQSFQYTDTSPVRLALQQLMPAVAAKLTVLKPQEPLLLFQELSIKGLLSELIDVLILKGEMPYWFRQDTDMSIQEWASLLITQQPAPVLQALRKSFHNEKTIQQFTTAIPFSDYIHALQQAWPQQAASLRMVAHLYEVFRVVNIKGVPASALQAVLYRLMIRLFKTDSRGGIDPVSLWKQLIIDLCAAYSVRPLLWVEAMQQNSQLLPPAMLAANKILMQELSAGEEERLETATNFPSLKRKQSKISRRGSFEIGTEKIAVKNAGLVIINMYLPMLFKRLGLVVDNQFISSEYQQDAVHYLQYLSAEQDNAPEEYLVLNKILCGLSPDSPVKDRIEITALAKETIDGLITAVVNYWPAIGDTSVDGFRGNWLVRDGLICEKEENWFLSVEKRAYDVLLAKSPFSFSFIKYPWMEKPLKTEWPF
ncbi:MAG: contractile injection system tape measure protein [Bacteroidetes bacterium]|nr:contractile injection system tape measure protein [Bacteroidota bacterium]